MKLERMLTIANATMTFQKGGNEGMIARPVHRGMTEGQTQSKLLGKGTKAYVST